MNLKKTIQDPLIKGGLAGAIAGSVMEIINLPFYYLKILKIRPIDFSYMVVTHKKAQTLLEMIVGLINHLLFASLSGIILSLVLLKTNYQSPILKGISLGLGTNIILLALGSFFNIAPVINITPFNILFLDLSAALPFGLTLALVLKFFHTKFDQPIK